MIQADPGRVRGGADLLDRLAETGEPITS